METITFDWIIWIWRSTSFRFIFKLNNRSKSLIEPPDNFLTQISQIQFISIQRSIIDSGPLKVFSFFNRIIKSLQRLSASKSFKFIDLDWLLRSHLLWKIKIFHHLVSSCKMTYKSLKKRYDYLPPTSVYLP